MATENLQNLYGVRYWNRGERAIHRASEQALYYFETYIGEHDVQVSRGDSIWWIHEDETHVEVVSGSRCVKSKLWANVVRGYQAPRQTIALGGDMHLPYVNGCSTRQLIPPARPGDPTLQFLAIPPYSSEQAHHIHSTVRSVYVLSGSGRSVVGMDQHTVIEDLVPGKVCILDPMCPHHFDTNGDWLRVVPLHVWSSGTAESRHPMFMGTHLMDHGA